MRRVCYNMYVIKREEKIHMNTIYYVNKTTGEATPDMKLAMQWYREGDEVALLDWSESREEWLERGYWAH